MLDKKKEAERILFEDADPVTGVCARTHACVRASCVRVMRACERACIRVCVRTYDLFGGIFFEDTGPLTGFILVPDMKWDQVLPPFPTVPPAPSPPSHPPLPPSLTPPWCSPVDMSTAVDELDEKQPMRFLGMELRKRRCDVRTETHLCMGAAICRRPV